MKVITRATRAVCSKLACGVLNPKAKRMMLVVSLATYLHTIHKGDELPLSKINELNISSKDEALVFPQAMSSRIWANSGIDKLDLSSDTESLAKQLMQHVPTWLRYGRTADMERDLAAVVRTAVA